MKMVRSFLVAMLFLISMTSCSKVTYPVELNTPFADLQVTGIQIVSSYPEGCDINVDDNCFQAEEGERVLIIWMVPKGDYDIGKVRNGIFDHCSSATLKFKGVDELPASTGGRVPDGRFYLQYFVPEGVDTFYLTWFENSKVKLTE